jgi:hypothetical protein
LSWWGRIHCSFVVKEGHSSFNVEIGALRKAIGMIGDEDVDGRVLVISGLQSGLQAILPTKSHHLQEEFI